MGEILSRERSKKMYGIKAIQYKTILDEERFSLTFVCHVLSFFLVTFILNFCVINWLLACGKRKTGKETKFSSNFTHVQQGRILLCGFLFFRTFYLSRMLYQQNRISVSSWRFSRSFWIFCSVNVIIWEKKIVWGGIILYTFFFSVSRNCCHIKVIFGVYIRNLNVLEI